MSRRPRHRYAADLPCGLPDLLIYTAREFPPQRHTAGRTAPGPHPPGSGPVSKIKDVKRRFLAYSFPPRSPDPPHLAVLSTSRLCQGCSRPPRHHPDQAALSFTALLRQDGGEGLSPPLEQQRLTAQTVNY